MRSTAPNALTSVQDAISAVTGVGAPWYTSGFQAWNGTAPILNSSPTPSSAMPANSRTALCGLDPAVAAIAASLTDPEYPYNMATPNRKNADENAPSRKYFIAASCESSLRRLASAQSRYSGSDSTSSATNMVSRSFDAGNSSMPPTATTCPALPAPNTLALAAPKMVSTKAPARLPSVTARCRVRRSGRDANASTSTPATAAPNTSSIGESWPYSMCGAGMAGAIAAMDPVTEGSRSCAPPGAAGLGWWSAPAPCSGGPRG